MEPAHTLPPLHGELFRTFSGHFKRWKAGEITIEEFRKSLNMGRGTFFHYLKEYMNTERTAIDAGEETTMAKKDFTAMNAAPVYNAIADATEAQEPAQKKTRKPVEAYSPERAEQMVAAGTTQGRKGCKAHRFNMAFDDDVHEYIRIMSRVRGESLTDFTNYVFRKSMADNAQLYEKAKAFRESLQ